jgi:hypothetical protein
MEAHPGETAARGFENLVAAVLLQLGAGTAHLDLSERHAGPSAGRIAAR